MRSMMTNLLILFALALPVSGLADYSASGHEIRPQQFVQSGGKSLNDAVQEVRRRYKNGRIISAETKVKGGREVHHIRVMVDGTVKTVKVNGRKRGNG